MSIDTPKGQVVRDDNGLRLEYRRTFTHARQVVWAALTEADLLAQWIGIITGDPDSGEVQFLMTEDEGDTPAPIQILTCAPPHTLDLLMGGADGGWPLSMILIDSTDSSSDATSSSTVLVFTQQMAEPFDASSIGPGWHYYLDRLEAVVNGEEPTDDWGAYYPALASAYRLPDGG